MEIKSWHFNSLISKKNVIKFIRAMVMNLVLLVLLSGIAQATTSTTFWTPMTPDIQPFGVLHIGVDNYFTDNKNTDEGSNPILSQRMSGLPLECFPLKKFKWRWG